MFIRIFSIAIILQFFVSTSFGQNYVGDGLNISASIERDIYDKREFLWENSSGLVFLNHDFSTKSFSNMGSYPAKGEFDYTVSQYDNDGELDSDFSLFTTDTKNQVKEFHLLKKGDKYCLFYLEEIENEIKLISYLIDKETLDYEAGPEISLKNNADNLSEISSSSYFYSFNWNISENQEFLSVVNIENYNSRDNITYKCSVFDGEFNLIQEKIHKVGMQDQDKFLTSSFVNNNGDVAIIEKIWDPRNENNLERNDYISDFSLSVTLFSADGDKVLFDLFPRDIHFFSSYRGQFYGSQFIVSGYSDPAIKGTSKSNTSHPLVTEVFAVFYNSETGKIERSVFSKLDDETLFNGLSQSSIDIYKKKGKTPSKRNLYLDEVLINSKGEIYFVGQKFTPYYNFRNILITKVGLSGKVEWGREIKQTQDHIISEEYRHGRFYEYIADLNKKGNVVLLYNGYLPAIEGKIAKKWNGKYKTGGLVRLILDSEGNGHAEFLLKFKELEVITSLGTCTAISKDRYLIQATLEKKIGLFSRWKGFVFQEEALFGL